LITGGGAAGGEGVGWDAAAPGIGGGPLDADPSPPGEVMMPPQYGHGAVVGGRLRGTRTLPLQCVQRNCFLSLGISGFSMCGVFP
jgi:hypothetical protein